MSRQDKIYDVNVRRLALLTLPTWLRRPLVGALIYSGVAPVGRLLGCLRAFRADTSYRLAHNGQVCRLRGVLNDLFDPDKRRIVIEDGGDTTATASMVWRRETERWIMVPQRDGRAAVVNRSGYGGISGFDFWVVVPLELRGEQMETRLRAVVNMYKLASKRYAVNYM